MGISLREMARRLKMSASILSLIERDRLFPSKAVASRIAGLFGVPVEDITQFDDRISISQLRRTIDRDPELRAAVNLMVREIESGVIPPSRFATAIRNALKRSR